MENDLDDAALVRGRAGFGGCGQEHPGVEDPSGLDGAAEDCGKEFPGAVARGDDTSADADAGAERGVRGEFGPPASLAAVGADGAEPEDRGRPFMSGRAYVLPDMNRSRVRTGHLRHGRRAEVIG
ncbi:hypothetical protein ACFRQM_20915 [Streptomyces sp. NPDC056831]|uniref:hypothetical protein n=1 Tax=Streptomyces sp. NPDC056831 TaxID=3345954 RepID=UPI0036A689BC